jgi:heme ABC exporter ATP-binding subunit CcmA
VTDGEHSIPGPAPTADPGATAAAPRFEDEPVIEFDGAISLIERFPALAGVTLTVDEGEIILLRGPNGAGKSTLLRLCAGLASLDGGRGQVLGHDLSSRRERRELRRQTGLLAHATFLYDQLTVEENLLFWARANRLDETSVEPVLDRLALANRLRDVRVGHLSAGQRRRASLAVLVCRRPRLWLLDEPHAGLDVNGRDFVDGLIKHAVAFGGTVLLASHDFDRAGEIATRTVVVAGGQVQESDPNGSGGTMEGRMALRAATMESPALAPRWGRDGGADDPMPVDSPLIGRPPPVQVAGFPLADGLDGDPDDSAVDVARPGAGPGSRWRGRRRAAAESS